MNDTAVNLFNSYLNTASQSPRVIAASRPSSPLKDKLNEVDASSFNGYNAAQLLNYFKLN